ncbi:hypothetical protein HKX48_004160 [Thoreauomyces humboldtii]|nr:hypothetical protein HKX48_004160 [Thoreauomyces humboldtii]
MPNADAIYLPHQVRLFDLRAGEPAVLTSSTQVGAGASDDINQVAVNARGTFLASADDSGAILVTDLRTGRPFKRLRSNHDNLATSVQFHPTKPWELWSGGMDCSLRRWDFSRGCVVDDFEMGSPETVPAPQTVNPPFVHAVNVVSQRAVAAGLGDGSVAVLGLRDGAWGVTTRMSGTHTWAVTALASVGETRLISGGLDGSLVSWDLAQEPAPSTSSNYDGDAVASLRPPLAQIQVGRKINCLAITAFRASSATATVAVGGALGSGYGNGTQGKMSSPDDIEVYELNV